MHTVRHIYLKRQNATEQETCNMITLGFEGQLLGWWHTYLSNEQKEQIKNATKIEEDRETRIPNGINTLIYTKGRHFCMK